MHSVSLFEPSKIETPKKVLVPTQKFTSKQLYQQKDEGLGITAAEQNDALLHSRSAMSSLFVALTYGHVAMVEAICSRHLRSMDSKPILNSDGRAHKGYSDTFSFQQVKGKFRSRCYWWQGMTPLMVASVSAQPEVVRTLLRLGEGSACCYIYTSRCVRVCACTH